MRELGADPADAALMQRLRDESPNANAALLQRPVLIVAGGRDERVPIRGVTHDAATLRQFGKDAGHEPADEHSREAWYYPMESLLHHRLGGPAPTPPSGALRGRDFQRAAAD